MEGHLDGVVGLRALQGWAANDQGQPPELRAYVNGVVRLGFTPSLERPDLASRFSRTDLGFVADLGVSLKIGDWVSVSAEDGTQLHGSPMQVTRLEGSKIGRAHV